MAVTKPIPAPRPKQGVRRSTTPSGVTHVRAYQSSHYTIIGDHLAQHRALSLVAIGLAVHILSLPPGAPVDIRSLAERFPEGRDRIAFALRELEAHGYLERVRERTEGGRFVTRTYAHNAPALTRMRADVPDGPALTRMRADVPDGPALDRVRADVHDARDEPGVPVAPIAPVTTAGPVAPATPDAVAGAGVAGAGDPVPGEPSPPPSERGERSAREPSRSGHRDKAFALLAGLRRTDDRFTLARKDVDRLTPAVVAWFDNGASRAAVIHALTADVPVLLTSPAGFLAHRLREGLPPPLPPLPPCTALGEDPPPAPVSMPPEPRSDRWTDCEGGCARVIPSAGPERCCRDCRARGTAEAPRSVPAA